VNGDYSSFDPNTVKTMVRMFDRNGDGVIGFDEFVSLWRFLAAWREIFDRFDEDRSGRISFEEFEKALVAFGYRLSRTFIRVLFTAYESKGRRRAVSASTPYPSQQPPPPGMSFDLFVQACISLKRMTDVFKRYDDDRDGYITISFEEFLTGELLFAVMLWYMVRLTSNFLQNFCTYRNRDVLILSLDLLIRYHVAFTSEVLEAHTYTSYSLSPTLN
jgi:Ca2+-binding EF-hand superfamily protein